MSAHDTPSPTREPRRLTVLLAALVVSPAAWITQLVATYGVASYACQPLAAPGLRPAGFGAGAEQAAVLAINLACLALSVAAGAAAWRGRDQGRPAEPEEDAGEIETVGHTRFLAVCGAMTAAVFAVAIAFNTLEGFAVPSCWRFGP